MNNTIAQTFERNKNQMLKDINSLVNNIDFENYDAIDYLKSLKAIDVDIKSYWMDDSLECGRYEIEFEDGNTQLVSVLWNETWNPFIQELITTSNDVTANELAHFLYNWLDENINTALDDIQAETEAEFRDELVKSGYHPQLIEMFIKVYNEEVVA